MLPAVYADSTFLPGEVVLNRHLRVAGGEYCRFENGALFHGPHFAVWVHGTRVLHEGAQGGKEMERRAWLTVHKVTSKRGGWQEYNRSIYM